MRIVKDTIDVGAKTGQNVRSIEFNRPCIGRGELSPKADETAEQYRDRMVKLIADFASYNGNKTRGVDLDADNLCVNRKDADVSYDLIGIEACVEYGSSLYFRPAAPKPGELSDADVAKFLQSALDKAMAEDTTTDMRRVFIGMRDEMSRAKKPERKVVWNRYASQLGLEQK